MDTSDALQPNSPFRLFVYVSNPEFTPQMNYWNFRIISPLAKTLDMRDFVDSFDITGRLEVDIQATFPYFGQVNPLRVVFVQSTILNQADVGNELADQRSLAQRKRYSESSDVTTWTLELHFLGMNRPCFLHLDDQRQRIKSYKGKHAFGNYLQQGEMLWGSGLVLAAWMTLESMKSPLHGMHVLELGSGLGTAGLVTAALGAEEVVLSDRSGPVFESLQRNVEVNHGDSVCKVRAVCLDWTKQSRGELEARHFDAIIGSDILYDSGLFPSLLRTLDELLLPGGSFLLVDPGRLGCSGCQAFADLIVEERPTWTIQVDTLSAATQFAREQVPNVEIFLPEQRRHGIAVLSGPDGFIFPVNCTEGFRLRLSNQVDQPTTRAGYDIGFVFPPAGMTCRGYDNATVSIRFPDGAGLLRNNYTLEIDVNNPGYPPNSTVWSFITRIRNDEEGERIADANRTLEGFPLVELLPMRTDEGFARQSAVLALLPLAFLWSSVGLI
eukprot:symbB.v1.2.005782.t2/scaffold289.1/size287290/27